MSDSYEEIYRKISTLKEYEPVPGDFLFKKTGAEIVGKFIDLTNSGTILEVGCGAGVNSAFLSQSAKRVIATDLPYYNCKTHSLGISVARNLLRKIDAKNVKMISCSGERLPFADNTFDIVFSFFVMVLIMSS